MKIFLWLFMLVFVVVCLSSWVLSSFLVGGVLNGYLFEALPAITRHTFYPATWMLIFPLPLLVYAIVLSFRRDLTPRATLVFGSLVAVATAVLLCTIVTACILASWPRPISMLPNQSPEPTPIGAFGNSRMLVAHLVTGSGWLSFGR